MITASHLSEYFRVTQPGKGVWDKLKCLVGLQHKIVNAVDDVRFEIKKGENIGYLGSNVDGKAIIVK